MLLGWAIVSLFFITSASSSCPTGTIHESGFNKCYKYVNENVSFLAAQEKCQQMGGNLVAVQNGFENSFVAGIAAASASPVSYWIGLNLLYSSEWSWMNKSTTTYENWAPSQPADPSPYQCAAVRDVDYHWTKELCNSARPFMCTIDPNGDITPGSPTCSPNTPPSCPITCPLNATCDPGYRLFHGTCQCYRADTRAYTYGFAQSTCTSEGGHFAFIFSPEENFFLQNLMQETYNQAKSVWIGLECLDSNTTSCAWLDGTPLDGYSNFETGQPNGQSQLVVLEYAKFDGQMDARWSSPKNPTGSASWICQKDSNLNQIVLS